MLLSWSQQLKICKHIALFKVAEKADNCQLTTYLNTSNSGLHPLQFCFRPNHSTETATFPYKSKESLSVCVCVYMFLKYLCGSWSDWPESFNLAAAWFKDVQRCICLDFNDTVNKFSHKCFTNSRALSTKANHCQMWNRPQHSLRS